MTPLGALVLAPLVDCGSDEVLMPATALMTGSFLYVATADMLPEVFHTRRNRFWHLALLMIGILIMILVSLHIEHGAH